MAKGPGDRKQVRGFTLIELLIVIAVLAVITSIGVPMYLEAVRTARTQKAVMELRSLSFAIDNFRLSNSMVLPLTLHQVGHGGRLDPWGNLYCYLNYESGTGDGLEWAVEAGLVNPASLTPLRTNTGGAVGGGRVGYAVPVDALIEPAPVVPVEGDPPPPNVRNSLYLNVTVDSVRRRDRFMFPLNSDYDLFSLGADRRTATSIGHPMSQDDVIRANDGGFFGVAARY